MTLRTGFMGSPAFAIPALEATARTTSLQLVVTQPDRPAGRGRTLRAPAVKGAALAAGFELSQPESVRGPDFEAALRALDLDLLVVTAYGKILPPSILGAARHGAINVHASVLPRWRGAAPVQRAILAGDATTGVSIMQLDEGCDTGPVYTTRETAIEPAETAGELLDRLARLGGEVLEAFLGDFARRPAPVPQDGGCATHAAKLERHEGRVDWSRTTRQVADHVRGMDPWPGAFTHWRGAEIKLFGARAAGDVSRCAPGTVIAVDGRGLLVATADGGVHLGELQLPGRKRLPAAVVASNAGLLPGESLENAALG